MIDHLHESHVIHHDSQMDPVEPPVSLNHLVHAVRSYRAPLILSYCGHVPQRRGPDPRLLTLTSQTADTQYRQKLVDEYRNAAKDTISWEQAVAYDQQVLQEVRSGSSGLPANAGGVHAQIAAAQQEVRQLIGNVNQIYQIISRNLNPSTQLFTTTAPATTRNERARTLPRLALYYVLILLLALPAIIVACLLHNRVREEEAGEERARAN